MKKSLFIFSGLGVDERIFQMLDLSDYSVTFIKWIEPKNKETIEQYAFRLLEQITVLNPILVGVSFGGMMAVEVSKLIDVTKLILISSAKKKAEIPFYYRLAGKLGLHNLMFLKIMKNSNFVTNWFFGAKSPFEKQLLKQILLDIDPVFLRWAIKQILNWRNEIIPQNLFHIHGTKDRILPISFANCDLKIKNGGHLMTLSHAAELSKIIKVKV